MNEQTWRELYDAVGFDVENSTKQFDVPVQVCFIALNVFFTF